MYAHIDFKSRITKLQKRMKNESLSAYIAVKNGSISYLLGAFAPWRTAVIVPLEGDPYAILWIRDGQRLAAETWISNVVIWPYKGKNFIDSIAKVILEDLKLSDEKIGIEMSIDNDRIAPGLLYAFEWEQMKEALFTNKLVNVTHILDEQMVIKEKEEITILRQVSAIADAGILAALDYLKPGITETELAGVAEYEMRRLGCEWFWSVTGGNEVGSGYRTCFNQGFSQPATQKIIQFGEMVIIDVHPMYQLYFADCAVSAVVGEPSSEQKKLADVWEGAVETLLKNMIPGKIIDEASKNVHNYIKENGYDKFCIPKFGHGLGTCTRIPPTIQEGNMAEFQENMVLTGGLYIYQPGIGGMRLELPILITKDGGESLSTLPLRLHVVK